MNVYETQLGALMDVTKQFNTERKLGDLQKVVKLEDEKHLQIEKDSGVCELARGKYQELFGGFGENYSVSRRSSACSSGCPSGYSGIPTTSPNTTASSAYSSAASSLYDTDASRRKSDAMSHLYVNSANQNNNIINGRVPPYHLDMPATTSVSSVPQVPSTSTKTKVTAASFVSQHSRRRSRGVSTASSKTDHSSEDSRRLYDSVKMRTYEKKRLLGKGGFARVYEVSTTEQQGSNKVVLEGTCAAKVIDKTRISRPQQREKVDIEVELLTEARGHPNVVNFLGSFEDENAVCILLELCNKKSLAQYLRKKQYLSEPEVSNIMLQIVSGLSHLHGQGIIHRDLKLGNILLTGDMQVKIGDFGLATRVEWGKKKTICGTPNFIAPEVLQRLGHGPEADIWALGCLLYTLLVGKPPFETACLKETYRCILKNSYRIPSTVSQDAADLIRWMLRHKPKSRPTLSEISSHAFFKKHAAPLLLSSQSLTTSELSSPVCTTPERSVSEVDPGTMRSSDDQSLTPVRSNVEKSQVFVAKSEVSAENQKQEGATVTGLSPVKRFTNHLQKKFSKMPSPKKCVRVAAASFRDGRKGDKRASSSSKGKATNPNTDSNQSALSASPAVITEPKTWVSKWVDYSNRYGFGYQLSNGRICVLFNDGKHISMLPGEKMIEYCYNEGSGSIRFSTDAVPPCLAKYAAILKNFAVYMDKTLPLNYNVASSKDGENARMLTWCRSSKYVVMYFNDGTLQVNFCQDHVKFNISSIHKQSAMRITVVDAEKKSVTYDGKQFAANADSHLKEKLSAIHGHFHSIFADVDCSSHPFCGVCVESGCSKCLASNEEQIISSFPVQV